MSIFDNLCKKTEPSRYAPDSWPSIVILMAEAWFPNQEEVMARAQRAWGNAGPVRLVGTLRSGSSYAIQCGAMYFSVHCTNARYSESASSGSEILQRPWNDHAAWMSVDLPNLRNDALYRTGSLGSMYKVLLVFVFLSWSNNCLAAYFPAEGITIPNFGDLAKNIQWARSAGLDVSFLN